MTPESFVVIFCALAIGSLAKGMTGLGLPTVSIAILAVFFGVEHAVVVTTIPVAFSNIQIVWTWRDRWSEIPSPWPTLGAAACGVALGTWVLANISERLLTIVLAIWIAFYLVTVIFRIRLKPDGAAAKVLSPFLSAAAGIAQGATGMSGPFVATWAHGWGFVKETYVFATSLLFLSISGTHVIGVAVAGLYDQERVFQGLLALIPVAIFIPLGMKLTTRISPLAFNWVIVGIIATMEVKLIWDLFAGN
ncbi:MAG: sulfite exporter TauE/SafE family protein [Alphaproteobacteria bacterium]